MIERKNHRVFLIIGVALFWQRAKAIHVAGVGYSEQKVPAFPDRLLDILPSLGYFRHLLTNNIQTPRIRFEPCHAPDPRLADADTS